MDVSIILVNWNSAGFLRNCLGCIYSGPLPAAMETVVVDNASFDGAGKMVQEQFPQVLFLQSGENLGFARANNLGVQASCGRILLFLNPDTVVRGEAIREMARTLESLPDAGALGCRILNGDESLQTSAVQSFPTILNQALDFEPLRRRIPRSALWGIEALYRSGNSPSPVEMVSGACLAIKRTVFERVGGFSPEYFMYGEDIDLCRKVWNSGWKIYYLPTASVIHFGGQSAKRQTASNFSTLCMQQSMQTYIEKFHGRTYAMAYRLSRAAVAFLRVAVMIPLRLLPGAEETRCHRKSVFEKWKTVLLWAAGFEKLPRRKSPTTGIPTQETTPVRQPTSGLV
jgi:GT2 family glycosyltransferase